MKSLACLALLVLANCVAGPAPTAAHAEPRADILEERRSILMLAAAAYACVGLDAFPKPGYEIAAVIAWDVEKLDATPDFLVERNRNFEYQGEVHHAEINAIRRGYERKKRFDVAPGASPKEKVEAYTRVLGTSTIFTTLEPCPMCAMTMLLSRVPRAIYFMDDPGLRNAERTPNPDLRLPTDLYGRKLVQEKSPLPEAAAANEAMWQARATGPKVGITDYLAAKGRDVFRPSYDRLFSMKAAHAANAELLERLKKAVGPLAR